MILDIFKRNKSLKISNENNFQIIYIYSRYLFVCTILHAFYILKTNTKLLQRKFTLLGVTLYSTEPE